VRDSILEIFRENAMRHHVIMVRDPVDDSLAALREGRIPELSALTLHNGTVWRWNRPCYGITDGKPHLRIENRALPAGPTIVDQVANVAFYYGLMEGMKTDAAGIPQRIDFEDARTNFFAAAQHGLAARFTWLDGIRLRARKLIRKELLPIARAGLETLRVPTADIDYYLGIIDARADSGRTGARWLLDNLANVREHDREAMCRAANEIVYQRQAEDLPVHQWDLIATAVGDDTMQSKTSVSDVMTTNLFTARPEDLVDLATSMMEWRHVRHVPVESATGELVGLLSTRELLRLRPGGTEKQAKPIPVVEIMQRNPPTIAPEASLQDAFTRILENEAGCLLVVSGKQLLGIVTERDLLEAAVDLIP
jgi:CBS domain-containing protein